MPRGSVTLERSAVNVPDLPVDPFAVFRGEECDRGCDMGSADYNVAKEALRALTRTAAREWARHGICCNIICPAAMAASTRRIMAQQPGMIETIEAANPMGRLGDPEADIAGVATFLASEDARYLTGNTLFVDGGAHINGVSWAPDLGD